MPVYKYYGVGQDDTTTSRSSQAQIDPVTDFGSLVAGPVGSRRGFRKLRQGRSKFVVVFFWFFFWAGPARSTSPKSPDVRCIGFDSNVSLTPSLIFPEIHYPTRRRRSRPTRSRIGLCVYRVCKMQEKCAKKNKKKVRPASRHCERGGREKEREKERELHVES